MRKSLLALDYLQKKARAIFETWLSLFILLRYYIKIRIHVTVDDRCLFFSVFFAEVL